MTSLLLTLLKLDFFFVFSFAAQLIPSQKLGYDNTITETVLVFVLGGLGLSLALIAVYRENKFAMMAFIVGGVASIGYFIYRIVKIAQPRPADADPYAHTRQFLIFTTVVAAALILLTVAVACKCFINVNNNVFIFKDKTLPKNKNKVYGNEQIAIDHESVDDYEMSGNPANASKTLLETNDTKPKPAHNENMWSIE